MRNNHEEIDRHLRALEPWPTFCEGLRFMAIALPLAWGLIYLGVKLAASIAMSLPL